MASAMSESIPNDVVVDAKQALLRFGEAVKADEAFDVSVPVAFALEALVRRVLPELVAEVERLRRQHRSQAEHISALRKGLDWLGTWEEGQG